MTSYNWNDIEDKLVALGAALREPTRLTVIGSTVSMQMGQPSRMTVDVDVWRRTSEFQLNELKRACQEVGIVFNPKGEIEPDQMYIQLIEPGIVQAGKFDKTTEIFSAGNLTIDRPPLENIIASKLVRGDEQDYDDIVYLMTAGYVERAALANAMDSIEHTTARITAQENAVMIDVLMGSTGLDCAC